MSASVEINDNKFNKSKISLKKGQHIRFKSTDGNTYVVDCGSDDTDISNDFPFTIPGDNKNHKVKVKDKAKEKNYNCSILSNVKKSSNIAFNADRPVMIIKVE
ncbi:MAG TPA: hypothetical protein VJ905_03615 [Halalkalibaculum sp.]|nr:hypothetical protein [Halalkalibaculum sp.]